MKTFDIYFSDNSTSDNKGFNIKTEEKAIRMALHISISDDKFPAGGKTYIENYPAIDEARSEIELAVRS